MFSLGHPRQFQPSGRLPNTRSYVNTAAFELLALLLARKRPDLGPTPALTEEIVLASRIHSATDGLSSSATPVADTVMGTLTSSAIRARRRMPARLPYS